MKECVNYKIGDFEKVILENVEWRILKKRGLE